MSMRIGFHTAVGGKNDDITRDYILPLDREGIPIVLKSVGDFGIGVEVLELKRNSGVNHIFMFRVIGYDVPNYDLPPQQSFDDHWQALYQVLPTEYLSSNFYRDNVILQIINEPDKNKSDWLGWFCYAAGQFAVANGLRFAMPSFSAGEPEPEHWEAPGMLAFLDYAGSHKHNVLVDLHEYSLDKSDIWAPRDPNGQTGFWHVGRFQNLFDVCDAHGIPHPHLTIGEFGWESTTAPYELEAMVDLIQVNALYDRFEGIHAVIWCLGPWNGDIADRVHDLFVPVKDYALQQGPSDPPIPPGQEPRRIKHTIHITPQDTTQDQMDALTRHLAPTKTGFTHSHDMVEAVMYHSTPDGEIHAWDDWRWPTNLQEQFRWLGVKYVPRQFSDIMNGTNPLFTFQHWPTEHKVITQTFGNNPEYYARFGLPGHEGVDIRAPLGSLLFAVAPGEVYEVVAYDDGHNYGIRVRVRHSDGYTLTYAHMQSVNVSVGDTVETGQVIGRADNTGNIIGGLSHSHITLKNDEAWEGGPEYIGYPYNIVDPTPFLLKFDPTFPDDQPPPSGEQYDLVPYLVPLIEFGPLYEVQTQYYNAPLDDWEPGPQQRHQTQRDSLPFTGFYHTKNHEWEQLSYDTQMIYRSIDTSPGEANGVPRYYELRDDLGNKWSEWCLRHMRVGATYYREPFVSFYNKDNCALLTQDRVPSLIKLLSVHDTMTFFTGITLADVIVLQWQDTNGTPLESYYYAQGYGLVGWKNHAGLPIRRSAISEIHAPGARPDNAREVINCI